jgi:hypothetical protein
MAEPDSMILPLLREIRAEINRRFTEMDARFDGVDGRFDRLEKKVENIRQAMLGESVLGRYAAAEVEERLDQLERRLTALEERR